MITRRLAAWSAGGGLQCVSGCERRGESNHFWGALSDARMIGFYCCQLAYGDDMVCFLARED